MQLPLWPVVNDTANTLIFCILMICMSTNMMISLNSACLSKSSASKVILYTYSLISTLILIFLTTISATILFDPSKNTALIPCNYTD